MEPWSRRRFLAVAAATTLGVAGGGCGITGRSRPVGPAAKEVAAAEARRRRPGAPVREVTLTAAPATIDLAGRAVTAWAYNHTVPGPVLRVRVGEVLRARLDNRLPEPTTIHWHGVVVRNDMDGVPGITQPPIPPGGRFVYEFTVPYAGTYFFHPHVGLQLDRGLYAALVVDDPAEPGGYDQEAVVVLDDWTLGVGPTPEQLQDRLMAQGGMMRGDMGMMGQGGGSPALGGHRLTVTHTDGLPVAPTTADALLVGMGERADALVRLQDGAFPLVALAEGKSGRALGVVRTGRGSPPPADAHPGELGGRLAAMAELGPDRRVTLPDRRPDRTHRLDLSGGMMSPQWTINGRTFPDAEPLPVGAGERVRLVFGNQSMMFHPMHLHGHSFQVQQGGRPGPRKDTVIVRPMQQLAVDVTADNPGQWMVHCHNLYHQEAGMMTTLSYVH